MRLDKFIIKSTDLSKPEITSLLRSGAVAVNGEVIRNEVTQVHENNRITLHGKTLTARASRYIMMHKPLDTICSNVDETYPSLLNYLDVEKSSDLHFVGRLDADTTGLVLVTDDGRWSYNIITPKKQCAKVYRVQLRDDVTDDVTSRFFHGVQLQGEVSLTLPAILDIVNPREVLLTITEGKFHQVKRMFAAVGNRVVGLHREKIGDVSLDIDLGTWRFLTAHEIQSFSK
ncbi:pseudouridine synthase [Neptunomonas japonica]|uniref:Pseudouridine synthase n=1 Tax=Neptunomonas japonica JAMM 1380 TaxID=1441457 RepID=A0A7R6SXI3_9GAMM|nr:pseudouridine synthase [Neptunomonas japonica]BBB30840.1 16S rRNA pseudouridine516 synthase [Neptunomonas japonica JAMM 1380]